METIFTDTTWQWEYFSTAQLIKPFGLSMSQKANFVLPRITVNETVYNLKTLNKTGLSNYYSYVIVSKSTSRFS